VSVTQGRWLGTFKTSGVSQLNGNPSLRFSLSFGAGAVCHFTAPRVNGTFNADGNPITLSTTKQQFKLDTSLSNSRGCPKAGVLNATWTLTYKPPGSGEEYPIILAKK